MIMSIDAGKYLTKFNIQHKTLNRVDLERIHHNIIKALYEKSTTNIIFNGEKPRIFPVRWRTRQGCPFLPLLFNILLEVVATAIRQEKEMKSIQIGKGEVKLPLFADNMIFYIENSKESIKKTDKWIK